MLPTIDEIAAAIRASRTEFGRMFLQAQVDYVDNPADRRAFEAVGESGVDAEAFKQALQYAQGKDWYEPLVHAIIKEGFEDGRLAQAMVNAAADAGDAALQAMTNVAAGFAQPEIMFRGLASGMRWTVKILIDGVAKGTGILIGPHLVLTAWHVVRTLFTPTAADEWEPDETAAGRLNVEFDDFLSMVGAGGAVGRARTFRVDAHKQWCVVFSHCHAEELNSRLPDDLTQLEGCWDYAVIRLAKTPGIERRWAALDARAVVPKSAARILVFQHPAGQPMRLDQGDILEADAAAAAAIPRLRFLHGANAVGGSSGGPCFDKTFMLFGFHQGEWLRAGGNGRVINRGIPLVRVLEHIKNQINDLPSPDPSENPIWNLGAAEHYAPVIGCDPFQSLVWRAAAFAGTPRIITLSGDSGSGKTFRIAVLAAMLSDAGNLKVTLKADAISKLDAVKLAEVICKTAGASTPTVVPNAAFNSTTSTWLRDEVVEKTVGALEAVRNGRLVWISIVDLNKTEIQGENAADFLVALCERARDLAWIRFVLDGLKGEIPASVRLIAERHRIPTPDVEDIKTYVRRAVADIDVPNEPAIRMLARQAERQYQDWIDQDAGTAMSRLAERAMEIVADYMEAMTPGGGD